MEAARLRRDAGGSGSGEPKRDAERRGQAAAILMACAVARRGCLHRIRTQLVPGLTAVASAAQTV
ncbi:MAG TPA: hypothetical protein VHO91_18790 [Rhodopila sp.]|nr:hypothetical protein [Rhodopila sp.]